MGVIRPFLRSRAVWTAMGILLAVTLGRVALRHLARDPRFLALPQEVVIPAPAWGGEDVVEPVRAQLKALGPINLFDERFVSTIRAALDAIPGVKRVEDIRRHWPDRYSVELTLHRPAAVVQRKGRSIPVTWEGVALPAGPFRVASEGLVRILGVPGDPPEFGMVWSDERLADGLAALAQIAPHIDEIHRLGLGRIDVTHSADPLEGVLMRGNDGIVVRWGRPRAKVGENPVEQKIGYLREASRYVEQVRGMEVDVRYNAIYVRNPTTQ